MDTYILLPAALGSLITGGLFCQFTHWGWFKWYWVATKLIATLLFVILGLGWFMPWLLRMQQASLLPESAGIVDPGYQAAFVSHLGMAALQALLVFVMVILSVFRPWGRIGRRSRLNP